jgi:hypothetical protein
MFGLPPEISVQSFSKDETEFQSQVLTAEHAFLRIPLIGGTKKPILLFFRCPNLNKCVLKFARLLST